MHRSWPVEAVRAAARAQGIDERLVFDMEGRDADWDGLSASIHAPSLFASRRLIEVRLPTGKPGNDGSKLICEFCADPPPDVVLLVVANDWSPQHAGKWTEAIARIGHSCIAWQVKPHELTDWIEKRHDPGLVKRLNAALRAGRFEDGMFQERTGKNVDDLWKEFIGTLPKRARV